MNGEQKWKNLLPILRMDNNLTSLDGWKSTLPNLTWLKGNMKGKDIDQDGNPRWWEEGNFQNVNIPLLTTQSNEELGTDTTDSSCKYEFCNLSSDDYYIVVDKSTLPDGYEITAQNQGDDDNTIVISTQMMVRVILLPSPMITYYSLDGGIYSPTYCLRRTLSGYD